MLYGKRKKFEPQSIKSAQENVERLLELISRRIENLKTQYNLFFAGEIRVPPESEREELEKMVRDVLFTAHKSPKSRLLIQNISSRFTLYNNMWKKKLNEVETGMVIIKKKASAYMENEKPKKKKNKEIALDISLNREDSFDNFYDKYTKLLKKQPGSEAQKEKVINSLKTTLITKNLIDAKINISVSDGKLKLKIKS